MSMSIFGPVFEQIKNLHYNYGKGDIKQMRIYSDGRIEVIAQRTSCEPHSSWGRLFNGRTIKMYRHQVTVKGLS